MNTGYMCKTDHDDELYSASGGVRVFPSISDLRRTLKCSDSCGIVEVKVELVNVVQDSCHEAN